MSPTVADRVARRFLARCFTATTTMTLKEALAIVQTCRSQIDAVLTEPEKLKALYLDMASKLRPLASRLDGIVIQRQDEARKFKNLRTWLRTLRVRTDPESFKGIRPERWEYAVTDWVDDLVLTLKSIIRVEERLTGYTTVQRVIPHPDYQILNLYGYQPSEYAEALKIIDDATAAIKGAGFGAAAYGKVTLKSEKNSKSAARYSKADDSIVLNLGVRHHFGDAAYSLTHELGHRVWFKLLSAADRDRYEDAYYGTGQMPISLAQREAFWAALEGVEFEPRRAKGALPAELRALFAAYWADRKKSVLMPSPATVAKSRDIVYRQFVMPKVRYYLIDHSTVDSVTDYGRTNVTEDFAEVFAHYCRGMILTADAQARFTSAIGKRG